MVYVLVAALICAVDLAVKEHIERKKEPITDKQILKGQITLTRLHNKGAFLNLMEKRQETIKLVSSSILAALVGALVVLLPKKEDGLLKTGLAITIGGAASNVYDRIKRNYVVDYFSFRKLKNVVFNIGDLFIFLGTFLIAIHSLFHKK